MSHNALLRSLAFLATTLFACNAFAESDKVYCQLALPDFGTATFDECSGIGSVNETIEHKVITAEGIEVVKKIPGRLKWDDIVLKRGLSGDLDLWSWRQAIESGGILDSRRTGTIAMVERDGTVIARWEIINAWPSSMSAWETDEDDSAGMEEMTLVVEYLERIE